MKNGFTEMSSIFPKRIPVKMSSTIYFVNINKDGLLNVVTLFETV